MTESKANDSWFFEQNGQKQGPIAYPVLLSHIQQGTITEQDKVWRPGFEEWVPAGTVAGLFSPPSNNRPALNDEVASSPLGLTAEKALSSTNDALSADFITRCIGGSARTQAYYRTSFALILEKAGIADKPLTAVDLGALVPVPWRLNSERRTMNFAAFVFGPFWLIWRKAYFSWAVFGGFLATLLIPKSYALTTTIYVLAAFYGNRLLLRQLLTELKENRLRTKPTSPIPVLLAIAAAIIIALATK